MNASHRRQRPFMAAIALLAATTAFLLWMGDDPSNFDEGEGAAEFLRRILRGEYQNPAMINNRLNLIS
eukprot:CAMPEP_0183739786 /NCGR_PEP_ID=MMETSP0737-20130205/57978_1 /TAXON_ID=385413 /ORGANISM="Thalassiosira miniscula, Strain CCMP1093" /LENGTH=67 /DNA_ID=CAMNT_0025974673 /DNA_START=62 /DNA_END=261 /DNA_ORIENTATION=-